MRKPDAILEKLSDAPLHVNISAKHEYGCKLPNGTKFYVLAPDERIVTVAQLQSFLHQMDCGGCRNEIESIIGEKK